MTLNRPPGLPPVPRDHADLTFSEVVPFRSSNIRLIKSPMFILFVALAIVVPALFTLRMSTMAQQSVDGIKQYFGYITNLSVFALLAIMTVGVYVYARTARPMWTFLYAAAVEAVIMMTPLIEVYFFVFRKIFPGDIVPDGSGFGRMFISMFFAAGLCEEIMKATPLLIAAMVGRAAARSGGGKGLADLVSLRSPLDGVLMGMFSAATFIYVETALEYVPGQLVGWSQKTGDPYFGMLMAVLLMIPRVLAGTVGHMAYSAVFGYFIGLAVIRPRQWLKLLVIGWLTSSLLHGLWNSVGEISGLLSYVIAFLSALGAAAVLLKARHLEAKLFGAAQDSNGSILVDRRPAAPAGPNAGTGTAAGFHPGAIPPVAPMPVPERPLALSIEGFHIPLNGGGAIDLGTEPALAGRGAGVAGAIVAHPTRPGVLGLRNTGSVGWTVWLRDGSQQRIERDQNIRLAPGTRIAFAPGLIADVVARG